MKPNDFDGIAKWYDGLAKLVFGSEILVAQCHFLEELPEQGSILIIGGGSGLILEELFRVRPRIKIDYVEASSKMLALAENRIPQSANIQFIHGTEADIPTNNYDGIITNFFLDVFKEDRLVEILQRLEIKLKKDGVWLCTDFQKTGKFIQDLLLKIMHVFFRLVSNLESNTLLDFEPEFHKLNCRSIKDRSFYFGMIKAAVYRPN